MNCACDTNIDDIESVLLLYIMNLPQCLVPCILNFCVSYCSRCDEEMWCDGHRIGCVKDCSSEKICGSSFWHNQDFCYSCFIYFNEW